MNVRRAVTLATPSQLLTPNMHCAPIALLSQHLHGFLQFLLCSQHVALLFTGLSSSSEVVQMCGDCHSSLEVAKLSE